MISDIRRLLPFASCQSPGSVLRNLLLCAIIILLLAGCASGRRLPPFEKPLAQTRFQHVRTTAYTHTEADHLKYGRRNALGTALQYGEVTSAAADWSRWPAGTRFRVLQTGREYLVDDYGWALAGTNTIDLYKASRREMNAWGVRRVNIEVLSWGDPWISYRILKPRRRHRHVNRMIRQIERNHRHSRPSPAR